jgi:protein SCO1
VRFDARALGTALREAGQGAVGTSPSPLLLLCYHFDPLTGRYSLAILDILRAAIAVFFLGAAFWAWRLRVRKAGRP